MVKDFTDNYLGKTYNYLGSSIRSLTLAEQLHC